MRLFWASVVISLVSIGISLSTIVSYLEEQNASLCDDPRREADFWRSMYLQADNDAAFVNCESIDSNYVICEKPHHAQR